MNEKHIKILQQHFDDADSCISLDGQTTLQEVYEAPSCHELFHQTLSGPISWQKRNGITLVEAVYSPNLAPQWVAALLALGTRSAFPDGDGMLSDFLRRTGARHSYLQAVLIPLNVPGRVWGEAHVGRTPTDDPIVSAIAIIDLGEEVVRRARLALTGVWREHVRLAGASKLLVGRPLNLATIEKVKDAVEEEVSPQDDYRGTVVYRRAVAGVLARRALIACMERGSQQ